VFGETMCDFWSSVALMTGHYKRNPPNMWLDIVRPKHFGRWPTHCPKAAREICSRIAELLIGRAENVARSLSWACSSSHPISLMQPPEARPMISA
jgi:hemoglobin